MFVQNEKINGKKQYKWKSNYRLYYRKPFLGQLKGGKLR